MQIAKCEWVAKQTNEASHTGGVTVRRGKRIPIWLAFRCLYCGEYFDQHAAEEHFGKKRSEYIHDKGGVDRDEVIEVLRLPSERVVPKDILRQVVDQLREDGGAFEALMSSVLLDPLTRAECVFLEGREERRKELVFDLDKLIRKGADRWQNRNLNVGG